MQPHTYTLTIYQSLYLSNYLSIDRLNSFDAEKQARMVKKSIKHITSSPRDEAIYLGGGRGAVGGGTAPAP